MKGLASRFRISAATVARLVRIQEFNHLRTEDRLKEMSARYLTAKTRCERCFWKDHGTKCITVQENLYYPHECRAYMERRKKP